MLQSCRPFLRPRIQSAIITIQYSGYCKQTAVSRTYDNIEATKLIKGFYSKKNKFRGRSKEEVITEALNIFESINGSKNHFAINTMLTFCLRYKCPDRISMFWKDIVALSEHSRSICECYSLIIMNCIESGDIPRFIEVLRWMDYHGHSLDLHIGHISKFIHSSRPTLRELQQIEMAMNNGMLPQNEYLQSALIKSYGNLGEIPSALSIYHSMAPQTVNRITTNNLLMAMVDSGYNDEAIELYHNVVNGENVVNQFDAMTHFMALRACSNLNDHDRGHSICSAVNFRNLENGESLKLKTQMIDFYGLFGDVTNALHLFHSIPNDRVDVVAVGAILKVMVNNEHHREAMAMYDDALDQYPNVHKDGGIHVLALKSCSKQKDAVKGEQIWESIPMKERTVNVMTTMIDLFGHCLEIEKALKLFHSDSEIQSNIVAVNAMLSAFIHCGQYDDALALYQSISIERTATSHVLALTACSKGHRFECGRDIYEQIASSTESSMLRNVQIQTALIDFFGVSGDIESALCIFESVDSDKMNIITINAMMTAFIHRGCHQEALDLFDRIATFYGIPADATTFTMAIKACGHLKDQQNGERIYRLIPEQVKWRNIQIETAMIQLYGHCGDVGRARSIFDGIECDRRSIVTINSMLTAMINNGYDSEALDLFASMDEKYGTFAIRKDYVLYSVAIKAATNSGRFEIGQQIHREIVDRRMSGDLQRGNGDTECHLINMYSKCGMVEEAQSILDDMKVNGDWKYWSDITVWNEMVNAHLRNGDVEMAKEMVQRMKEDTELRPNEKTMSLLLNGCSHCGDIEGATKLWEQDMSREMKFDSFIIGTLVDCCARRGHLYAGFEWIYRYEKVKKQGAAKEEDYAMWMALLHGCRQQHDLCLAKYIYYQIQQRFKRDQAKIKSAAVLLTNLHGQRQSEDRA